VRPGRPSKSQYQAARQPRQRALTVESAPGYSVRFDTSEGSFLASYSAAGLCRLEFPRAHQPHPAAAELPAGTPAQFHHWHRLTVRAVQAVVAGRLPAELPPLDLAAGTEFQRQVWRQLLQVKRGATRSYGEVAAAIGKPKAVRAVGGACGANPIPVLIPCHRILAANQRLGGFSGGLDWKRRLLAREGSQLFLE